MVEKTSKEMKHELKMLILSFILVTLIGGALTAFYGFLNDKWSLAEERRSEATLLFREISTIMDTRLYLWRKIAWAIQYEKEVDEIYIHLENYRGSVNSWNFNLNKNRALLCRYFGPNLGRELEITISKEFTRLQNILTPRLGTDKKVPNKKIGSSKFEKQATDLNRLIYQFNNQMAEQIRAGNIGSKDPGKACSIKA